MKLTCSKYISPDDTTKPSVPCEKHAKTFYLHNDDICCYCAEHDYQCGEQVSEDAAIAHISRVLDEQNTSSQ